MSLISSNVKKSLISRLPYVQVSLVFLAFGLMVFSSYFFGRNLERDHLNREAESLFVTIEAQLIADMEEFNTMLGVVSETMRGMLIQGASLDEAKAYINDMTDYGHGEKLPRENGYSAVREYVVSKNYNDVYIPGFVSVFAMFDIFGGAGYNGLGWSGSPGYIPEDRPWYIAAASSKKETVVTDPYVDAVVGEVALTFVRNIFDDNGKRIAIICIDVLLDRIYAFSSESRSGGVNRWLLIDRNLVIIAHPNNEYLGKKLNEVGSELSKFAVDLEQGLAVTGRKFINYASENRMLTIRQIENGWHLGVATPVESYYANMREMQFFLIILGLLLATGLSIILARIVMERNKAESQTHLMFDSMPMCANYWDKNLKNISTNEESAKLFGLSSKHEYLEKFNDLSPEHQPNGELSYIKARQYLRKAFDEGYCRFEWMHKKINGELMPCEVTLVRVWNNDEYVVLGYTRDLREEKKLQAKMDKAEELQEMLKNIATKEQEANQLKSRFLATVSHEIRTPMNAILGVAEMQLQNEEHSTDTEEAFTTIYDSGNMLLNIINDILDLSKIEAGKLEIIPYRYDIPSLITDTVQLNRLRYESMPISFNLKINKDMPLDIFGDELRVKQILNNLLSNAYKYTNKGEIELDVTFETIKEQEIMLILRVSDTGQGMTKDQIGKLFNEYTRFNLDANRAVVGAGLGMSITKRLIEMMGGVIHVESEPEKGSVFTVHLPQKRIGEVACGTELTERLQKFDFQNLTKIKKVQIIREYMPYGNVLVVDDVASNLYVAKAMLLPYGMKIETVESGIDAINVVKAGRVFDIIFMDHMMPVMDGVEAVKNIREMGYTRPIVALTANAVLGQAEMFLANGFDSYISKPIDSRELNAVLNGFIRDKQLPEVLEAARRKKEFKGIFSMQKILHNDELKRVFMQDAEKAVSVLNKVFPKIETQDEADFKMYIVTVHGMKSVLSDIGEKELSAHALKLEQAGRDHDISIILNNTPSFIAELENLILRFKSTDKKEDAGNSSVVLSNEDIEYLQDKMAVIKTACEALDGKTAKSALVDLRQKSWPYQIEKEFDIIAGHLLHSSFKKALTVANTVMLEYVSK